MASKTAGTHFGNPDIKIYLMSGVFNGYAYTNMKIEIQPDGQLQGEGIFSFVEMFGGEATGNSFLGRYSVGGQLIAGTVPEVNSEGSMTGTITIVAGTGNLTDLSGSLDVRLDLKYNSYFYQVLWTGVFGGKLNHMP